MLNIIISLLTFVLILVSLFLILVVLMQRANTSSGMGSAFGGGVAESAFGAETANILTRATKWGAFAFFLLALGLYLLYLARENAAKPAADAFLPDIPVPVQQSVPAPVNEPEPAAPEAGETEPEPPPAP